MFLVPDLGKQHCYVSTKLALWTSKYQKMKCEKSDQFFSNSEHSNARHFSTGRNILKLIAFLRSALSTASYRLSQDSIEETPFFFNLARF